MATTCASVLGREKRRGWNRIVWDQLSKVCDVKDGTPFTPPRTAPETFVGDRRQPSTRPVAMASPARCMKSRRVVVMPTSAAPGRSCAPDRLQQEIAAHLSRG